MISNPCHPAPLSATFLLPVAGTYPAALRSGRGFSSIRIPERNLPEKRHDAGRAKGKTRPVHRLIAAEASRESPASGASDVARARKPSRRGCSSARNGGKVSDATCAACSDLKTISLNRLALRFIPAPRAWREPGEGFRSLSRFALIQIPQRLHGLLQVLRCHRQMSAHLFVQLSASFVCASLCRGST